MKTKSALLGRILCGLLALGCFATTPASVTIARPRIATIQLVGSNLVVTVDVPSGLERVVLESCRRGDQRAWVPRAMQRISAAGPVQFVLPAATGESLEMFRIRADEHDPLPAAFYSGRSEFAGEPLGLSAADGGPAAIGTASVTADAAALYSVTQLPTLLPGVAAYSSLLAFDLHTTNADQSADSSDRLGFPVDRVVPMGDWLIEFSGPNLRVCAATNPGVLVKAYALDDFPVLGVTSESNRIHVLQGRGAPGFGYVPWGTGATNEASNRGLLRHTVIEATHLPELTFAGVANAGTTHSGWFSDARPLWPQPGLLVWSVNTQQNWWWNVSLPVMGVLDGGVGLGVPATQVSFDITSPGLALSAVLLSYWPSASSKLLVAVDVPPASAPLILSQTPIAANASSSSDTFAADGLVMFSHANFESDIVSTNIFIQTNQVWVSITNRVWQTNLVSTPVIVTETNAPSSLPLDAVKLRWPGTIAGSRLAAGFRHSLGLNGDGVVLAWGDNVAGAAGPAQPAFVSAPSPVALARPVVGVAVGFWQSFALDADGAVGQWGSPDGAMPPVPGQATPDFSTPQTVPFPEPITTLAAGGWHTLALGANGRLWAWGRNTRGQLGMGHSESVTEPQQVAGTYATIAGGTLHSLALDASGRAYSWGWNDFGQLGRSGVTSSPALVESTDGITFRAIAAGGRHSLALANDGVVWGWGDNAYGQLGPLGAGGSPQPVRGLPPARAIAAGFLHSLVLAQNGAVWFIGQTPDLTATIASRVAPLTNIVALGAGLRHSLALTADGDLFEWGGNLPVGVGAGEAVSLLLVSETGSIRTRTNYVTVTNVFQAEQISQQLQPQLVTNAMPVYRSWNRHWLDVVDYQQDAAIPVTRDPVSLPGLLQGLSHGGAMLYTMTTADGDPSSNVPQTSLSAVAYDGVAAHLVSALTVATNANEDRVLVAVNPNGVVAVARDSGSAGQPRRIECWRLDERGRFGLLGALDRTTPGSAIKWLDELMVLRVDDGFELVDAAKPAALLALPMNPDLGWFWADLNQVRGGRQTGVWLPGGEQGSLLLWRR